MKSKSILALTLALLSTLNLQLSAFAQGTAFTYQGRLTDSGVPANGSYDLTFQLFNAVTNGTPVGTTNAGVAVANGLFVTSLDFGAVVFDGSSRWLEISAKTNGAAGFTTLSPRQPLSPTPYALFAPTAATANGVATNAVSAAQLNTPGAPATGQVLSFNGTSLIWTNASTVAAAWTLNGNAGTTPGVNFLGTTDNQPVELRVNGQRALRLEPTPTNGTVNVIGGANVNFAAPGVMGATISGGGAVNYLGTAYTNQVSSDFGTIAGGSGNIILTNASSSTISGGNGNSIGAFSFGAAISGGGSNNIGSNDAYSTIGGGVLNTIYLAASYSTIAGGFINTIGGYAGQSTIGGGAQNTIKTNAALSTIAGGSDNSIGDRSSSSTISGGGRNTIQADAYDSTISGGIDNTVLINAKFATISGGQANVIGTNAAFAVISGGASNTVSDARETIGGGALNTIQSSAGSSTISGGLGNMIQVGDYVTTISGGAGNVVRADSSGSTIAGGEFNTIGSNSFVTTIGGGFNNMATDSQGSTVSGGTGNSILNGASSSAIGGGNGNVINTNANGSTIGGGTVNVIQSNAGGSTIGGGSGNTVGTNAAGAVIAGGIRNTAGGQGSFAAGSGANALHNGAFVWSDFIQTVPPNFASTATNEFAVRATGGVRFVSAIDTSGAPVAGVTLPSGSGSWSSLSDRNAKENLRPVDGHAVLEKVAALPLATWNYKSQDNAIRHIGPMAQDFRAAFGVGENETTIATIDADGVALAAIQGLNQKLEEKDAEIQALRKQLASLEKNNDEREARLARLEKVAESWNATQTTAVASRAGD